MFYSWRVDSANVYCRWITSNFSCKWHTKSSLTSLDSPTGRKSSPGKVFFQKIQGQQRRTWRLQEREHRLAQRRGTPSARDRGYSDHMYRGGDKIVLTITLQTKPIKRGNTDCRRFKKMPPIKFATKAMRRGNAWSLQSKLCVGSKNYTICKVHVRNIFPTDWGQPQPLHHEQQWVYFTAV